MGFIFKGFGFEFWKWIWRTIWIVDEFGDEWLMMMKVLDDYLGWSDEYLVWGWWRWRLWGYKDEDECLKDEDL